MTTAENNDQLGRRRDQPVIDSTSLRLTVAELSYITSVVAADDQERVAFLSDFEPFGEHDRAVQEVAFQSLLARDLATVTIHDGQSVPEWSETLLGLAGTLTSSHTRYSIRVGNAQQNSVLKVMVQPGAQTTALCVSQSGPLLCELLLVTVPTTEFDLIGDLVAGRTPGTRRIVFVERRSVGDSEFHGALMNLESSGEVVRASVGSSRSNDPNDWQAGAMALDLPDGGAAVSEVLHRLAHWDGER